MHRFKLDVVPLAREQIHGAVRWWRANRDKAPRAFGTELRKAFKLIRSNPRIGRRIDGRSVERFCVTMRRVRYGVYYEIDGATVRVLAVWQSNRGSLPKL